MDSTPAWRSGVAIGVAPVAGRACEHCAREQAQGAAERPLPDRPLLTSPEAAAAVLQPWLGGHDRERCVLLLLDTKHRLLDTTLVSIGTIDHTFMNPREILRDALLGNAAAIIVGHNHPSGDVTPSPDDRAVTTRLAAAARTVGIELLDHLVVGGGRWASLARLGVV
ncbi:MAG: JAB domain-containing protein [Nitriliruptorales bacterium]|nr:JAB domain-containing protein [Nitriliruptorales bacterium]